MGVATYLDEICDNCHLRRGYHYLNDSCPNKDLTDAKGARGVWRSMSKPIFQPQVKVGQVWANGGRFKWCITEVDHVKNEAYAYRVGDPPDTADEFGPIDEYGNPKEWGGFYLDEGGTVPIQNQPATKAKVAERSDLEFFRQPSTPGYCPCGIAREQCSYHR